MSVGHFLGGIAALIWDPAADKYLLLRRNAAKDVGAGHWECVTGRVDQGEGFEAALHREVREELGVPVRIEFLLGTTHFYRGAPEPENELVGVVYTCSLTNPEAIRLSPEHDAHHWLNASELHAFLPDDHWLRPFVTRAEQMRQHTPPALRQLFQREGFEIG